MKNTKDYITTEGKQMIEMVKKYDLYDYYDYFSGIITIPVIDFKEKVKEDVFKLLMNETRTYCNSNEIWGLNFGSTRDGLEEDVWFVSILDINL